MSEKCGYRNAACVALPNERKVVSGNLTLQILNELAPLHGARQYPTNGIATRLPRELLPNTVHALSWKKIGTRASIWADCELIMSVIMGPLLHDDQVKIGPRLTVRKKKTCHLVYRTIGGSGGRVLTWISSILSAA